MPALILVMIYNQNHCSVKSNYVINISKTNVADALTVISLEKAKSWLRVDTDDDDSDITDIINEAVEWAESTCGISIRSQTISAVLSVMNIIELPQGPVTSITSVSYAESGEDANAVIKIPGTGFTRLEGHGKFTAVYDTGYDPVPPGIIGALKSYIAYAYEHRGDELSEVDVDFAYVAKRKIFPYNRNLGV